MTPTQQNKKNVVNLRLLRKNIHGNGQQCGNRGVVVEERTGGINADG